MSGPTEPLVVVSGIRPAVPVERQLLAELKAAHQLLALALQCMPPASKAKFAQRSELTGLAEDGATRHHERAALIARVESRAERGDTWAFTPADVRAMKRLTNAIEQPATTRSPLP